MKVLFQEGACQFHYYIGYLFEIICMCQEMQMKRFFKSGLLFILICLCVLSAMTVSAEVAS